MTEVMGGMGADMSGVHALATDQNLGARSALLGWNTALAFEWKELFSCA
jgi:hypothetical protein